MPSDDIRQTRRLAKIVQKGEYRKLFLPVTLQHDVDHDAVLDTAADISVMSTSVFLDLQRRARHANDELQMLYHPIRVRPYAKTSTRMDHALLCLVQVGHMAVEHPIYVSELEHVPLLLGRDFLLRLQPILDLSEGGFTLSTNLLRPDPADLTDFVKCDSLKERPSYMVETVPPLDRGDPSQRRTLTYPFRQGLSKSHAEGTSQSNTDVPAKARANKITTENVVLNPTQIVCLVTNSIVGSLQTPPLFGGRLVSTLLCLSVLLLLIAALRLPLNSSTGGSTRLTVGHRPTPCKKGGFG